MLGPVGTTSEIFGDPIEQNTQIAEITLFPSGKGFRDDLVSGLAIAMDRAPTFRSQFNDARSSVGWVGGATYVSHLGKFAHFPANQRCFEIGQSGQKREPNRPRLSKNRQDRDGRAREHHTGSLCPRAGGNSTVADPSNPDQRLFHPPKIIQSTHIAHGIADLSVM
ncbi:hypothetical protein MCETE7_00853 [Acidimicrobiia bacterium]